MKLYIYTDYKIINEFEGDEARKSYAALATSFITNNRQNIKRVSRSSTALLNGHICPVIEFEFIPFNNHKQMSYKFIVDEV